MKKKKNTISYHYEAEVEVEGKDIILLCCRELSIDNYVVSKEK